MKKAIIEATDNVTKRYVHRKNKAAISKLDKADVRKYLTEVRRVHFRRRPLDWAIQNFGIKPWEINWSLLPEYRDHMWDGTANPLMKIGDAITRQKWVAIEGAVSTGKTVWLAILACWFFDNFENSIVITTAPKQEQLPLNIWKWIPYFYRKLGRGHIGSLNIRMRQGDDSWVIRGYGAGVSRDEIKQSAARAQSIHAPNMLFILEEAPGIPDAVLSAYENSCTAPNNIIIAVGNPNHQQDTLHRFALRRKVEHIRVSGFDCPNVVCNNPTLIEGAQTRTGLLQLADKYHPNLDLSFDDLLKTEELNNPMFLSRGRGISPGQAADALIRYEWCIAAAKREPTKEQLNDDLPAMGVDVANSLEGDEAAVAYGEGSILYHVESERCSNANLLGAEVCDIADAKGIASENIGIDGIGVGAGAVNECERLGRTVYDIQSGQSAVEDVEYDDVRMRERFGNLRAQMWWMMMLDLKFKRVILPWDEELFGDLSAPKWKTNKAGQILIESKDDIRSRLGRSPNKGDAAVYWNWTRRGYAQKKYKFGILG